MKELNYTMRSSPPSDYVEIRYQDSIIAEAGGGKIITLACDNTHILSDLIIKNIHLDTTSVYDTLNVEIKYGDTLIGTLDPGKQAKISSNVRFLSDIIINVFKAVPQSNFISSADEVIITRDALIFKVKE